MGTQKSTGDHDDHEQRDEQSFRKQVEGHGSLFFVQGERRPRGDDGQGEERGPGFRKGVQAELGLHREGLGRQANIFAVEPQVYLQGEENTALVLGVTVVGLAAAFGLGYTLVNNKLAEVDDDLAYLYER